MTPLQSFGGTLLCVLMGASFAQNVDLKGVARDRYSSAPIAQATVTLLKLGYSARTDSTGAFHILHIPTGRLPGHDVPGRFLQRTGTGGVAFRHEGGEVEAQVIDVLGKPSGRALKTRLAAGGWEYHPGSNPDGIAVICIKTRSHRESIKLVNLGGSISGSPGVGFRAMDSWHPLSKAAAAVDSLRVVKAGYLPTTLPLESLVQPGLAVRISDTTVSMGSLSGLTLSVGALDPPFDPAVGLYEVLLRESATSLRLTPISAPAKPWILIKDVPVAAGSASGPFPLSLFSNDMLVSVKSQDSTARSDYYVAIHRADDDSAGLDYFSHSAGTLTPAFKKGVTAMTLEVPAGIPSVTLTPVAIQPLCAIAVNGKAVKRGGTSEALPVGDSISDAVIEVSSPDGTRKSAYTITLKRVSNPMPLSGFAITPGTYIVPLKPAFHPDTMVYRVTVNNSDSVLGVTLFSTMAGAALSIGPDTLKSIGSGEERRFPLKLGGNTIRFRGTATNVTTLVHVLYCLRPKVMPVPIVSGPNDGYVNTLYTFITDKGGINNSPCDIRTTGYYIYDWGDGKVVNYSVTSTIRHAFAQPGTYQVKARTHCREISGPITSIEGYSDWSSPRSILIHPADTRPIRNVSGPRSASETWSPDTVYVVTANTLFEEATTLTILPGTRVKFNTANLYLLIKGRISALGTAQDSIRFEDGMVKTPWRGPVSYNPDGTYLAGPRFEYCSFRNAQLWVADENTSFGGYGVYLKNSYVHSMGEANFYSGAVGTYIEKCRIGALNPLRMAGSRILNSHIGSATLTSSPGTVKVQGCDFGQLYLESGSFAAGDVAGNTIRSMRLNIPSGTVQGNNLLAKSTYAVQAGKSAFNLQGNYWGDSTTVEMEAEGPSGNIAAILDYLDNIELARIDYGNWKSSLIPNSIPDW